MKFPKLTLLALTLGSLCLAGCGDDDDNDNGPTTAPQTVPQPQSAEPLWTRIVSQREVETTNTPGECSSPRRFLVQEDGTFFAGPCSGDATDLPTEGALTPEEFAELNRRLNLMLEAEQSTQRVCQEVGALQNASILVTRDNNTTFTAFSEGSAGRCFRGDATLIQSVREFMLQLEAKYLVSASPSPSPTASPSPTTSPSPSGSPSPSPSPSPTVSPTASPSPTVTVTPVSAADGMK